MSFKASSSLDEGFWKNELSRTIQNAGRDTRPIPRVLTDRKKDMIHGNPHYPVIFYHHPPVPDIAPATAGEQHFPLADHECPHGHLPTDGNLTCECWPP